MSSSWSTDRSATTRDSGGWIELVDEWGLGAVVSASKRAGGGCSLGVAAATPTMVDGGGTCSVGLTRLDDVRRCVVGEGRGDAKSQALVRRRGRRA